jgi:hypothetical protein
MRCVDPTIPEAEIGSPSSHVQADRSTVAVVLKDLGEVVNEGINAGVLDWETVPCEPARAATKTHVMRK